MRFLAVFKLPRSGHFFAAQSAKKRRSLLLPSTWNDDGLLTKPPAFSRGEVYGLPRKTRTASPLGRGADRTSAS